MGKKEIDNVSNLKFVGAKGFELDPGCKPSALNQLSYAPRTANIIFFF